MIVVVALVVEVVVVVVEVVVVEVVIVPVPITYYHLLSSPFLLFRHTVHRPCSRHVSYLLSPYQSIIVYSNSINHIICRRITHFPSVQRLYWNHLRWRCVSRSHLRSKHPRYRSSWGTVPDQLSHLLLTLCDIDAQSVRCNSCSNDCCSANII